MKIIIDVPNESYAWIKEHTSVRDYSSTTEIVLCDAIRNGVPYEEGPTGEWIEGENGNIKCNKCGCEIRYSYLIGNKSDFPNFCCDCGAKMMKGEEK